MVLVPERDRNTSNGGSRNNGSSALVLTSYESNQPSLFEPQFYRPSHKQVSGVHSQSPSASESNLSGEGSRAGIQVSSTNGTQGEPAATPLRVVRTRTGTLPDVCRRRHGGNAQSEAANAKVAPAKKGMRVAILAALAASDGLTLKELAKQFNKQLNQISGRVTELLADRLIERTSAERDGCAVLRTKGTNA